MKIPEQAPERQADKTMQADASQISHPSSTGRISGRAGFWLALAVAALLGGGAFFWWDHAAHFETTDDAFIDARSFPIAPKVSGYLAALVVRDNQHVKAGDIIARIDDRDYQTALRQAEAQLQAADASMESLAAQIRSQQAQAEQARAEVEQNTAALAFARAEAARAQDLVARGAGTVQSQQQTQTALLQAQANLSRSQAGVVMALNQIEALQAQSRGAAANRVQAEAQRDQARLNLGCTTLVAQQSGQIVQLSGAVGQFLQAGASFAMFVPDELWLTANVKETQLARMRPGQPVDIRIDAYPDKTVRGRLDSVQPGSGAAFSLLPPQNATGNYVKIVQRVPVKITIDELPAGITLGPGMSVVPRIRVDPSPSLYEKLLGR